MKKFRLLMTKKTSPSLVLQAGLKGVDILEKEFIEIVLLKDKQLSAQVKELAHISHHVVFSSKNAVNAVSAMVDEVNDEWKIYCIEGATKEAAEDKFGASKIVATARNAGSLARTMIEQQGISKVVFFCGDRRLDTLPDHLRDNNVEVVEVVVYNTIPSPQRIVDDFDAVAFFSPSAVRSFFTMNTLSDKVLCLSVGATTSDAIRKYTSNKIFTAESPSEEVIIDMAIKLSNKNYY
jgi:uroporphyrinogen-III synthase